MERKHNAFFAFLLLVNFFFVLVAFFMIFGFVSKSNETLEDSQGEIEVNAENTILGITEDYGQSYIDQIIFLGESTTYGLKSYGLLADGINTKQVWTGATLKNGNVVSSGTLSLSPTIAMTKIFYPDENSAITISDAVKLQKPKYLIITLGLNNGASYYSEQEFKKCYRFLLDSIKFSFEDTNVILQSLFPVTQNCSIKAYTPQRIQLCNEWIYDIAKEYNLKYLNTFEALSDNNGYLVAEYDNGGDGIHLNAKGLCEVINYIRTHGYPED